MGTEILDLKPVLNVHGYEDIRHVRFGTQMNADYTDYFLKLSKTFLLISGSGPKFSKRPTSISVALR